MAKNKLFRRFQGIPRTFREADASLRILGSLRAAGWQASLRRMARDSIGDYLPWFTYPAIEWLGLRVNANMNVFEWGAGASTLYFAKRCSSVVSVEHDPKWVAELQPNLPKNVTLVSARVPEAQEEGESAEYVAYLEKQSKDFHIIVVDALFRRHCLAVALEQCNKDSLIIVDNSQRGKYQLASLKVPKDILRLDFVGYGPGASDIQCTSIFLQDPTTWLASDYPIRDTGF